MAAVIHNSNKSTNPCGSILIRRSDVDENISWCQWAEVDHSERWTYFPFNDATNQALKSQTFQLSILTNTGYTTKGKGAEKTCAHKYSALLLWKKSKHSHVKKNCMKPTAFTIKSLIANFQNSLTNHKQKIPLKNPLECDSGTDTPDNTIQFDQNYKDSFQRSHSYQECYEKRRTYPRLMLLADFSKAFDTINFKTVLKKLHRLIFSHDFSYWITSYLTNRFQYVQIDDKKSILTPVCFGVPQGSILNP